MASDPVKVITGLRQGDDALSPTRFKQYYLVLEKIIRYIKLKESLFINEIN